MTVILDSIPTLEKGRVWILEDNRRMWLGAALALLLLLACPLTARAMLRSRLGGPDGFSAVLRQPLASATPTFLILTMNAQATADVLADDTDEQLATAAAETLAVMSVGSLGTDHTSSPTSTSTPAAPGLPAESPAQIERGPATNTPVPVAPGLPTNTPVPLPTGTSIPGSTPAQAASTVPAPTATKQPTPTFTLTPLPSSTPRPTRTPTQDVCSEITITGFTVDKMATEYSLKNGSSVEITVTSIYLDWPSSNSRLRKIKLKDKTIWGEADDTPPTLVDSDWDSEPRELAPGETQVLRFEFSKSAATTGYDLEVAFDSGCSREASD
jgi:hypothetical protein